MQYICSEKPMRCLDKVTALHPLTHRIVFVIATYCVFSLIAFRPKYVSYVLLSNLKSHNSLLRPPQECSIRRLSCGIHADLCRARVII